MGLASTECSPLQRSLAAMGFASLQCSPLQRQKAGGEARRQGFAASQHLTGGEARRRERRPPSICTTALAGLSAVHRRVLLLLELRVENPNSLM